MDKARLIIYSSFKADLHTIQFSQIKQKLKSITDISGKLTYKIQSVVVNLIYLFILTKYGNDITASSKVELFKPINLKNKSVLSLKLFDIFTVL